MRAYNGQNSRWYQAAVRQKAGRITAAGMTKEVTFEPVDGPINDRIDDAYRDEIPWQPVSQPDDQRTRPLRDSQDRRGRSMPDLLRENTGWESQSALTALVAVARTIDSSIFYAETNNNKFHETFTLTCFLCISPFHWFCIL